jgi:hypothetical protein
MLDNEPMKTLLLTLLFASVSATALFAQDPVVAGPTTVPPHRFWNRLNIGLTVMESSALLYDGIVTRYTLGHYPNNSREADPIAKPFVDHGWTGQILGGAFFVAADNGVRYWLHRTGHHRAERWMPLVLTSYGGVSGSIDVRNLLRLRREIAADNAGLQRP